MTRSSSHASFDFNTRKVKAVKVQRLIERNFQGKSGLRLLEIGAGSGVIAHFFATEDSRVDSVTAVDVRDQRIVREGYAFELYDGEILPFDDASFDIVISNHVIEHVGGRREQLCHLREMARVLRPLGIAYLASPSRWQLIEPHFRLLGLSWIPRRWRNAYVRLARKGAMYDCDPLAHREIEGLLLQAGFQYENRNVEALGLVMDLEHPKGLINKCIRALPMQVKRVLYRLSPTMIYTSTTINGDLQDGFR